MDFYLGSIAIFPYNFIPSGWAACDGRLVLISSNPPLFALLGTTYGGDGQTTFGLPDLRGRTPIGTGNVPGLSDYRLGTKGGAETATLTVENMPAHSHPLMASFGSGNSSDPNNRALANAGLGNNIYQDATPDTSMNHHSVGITGVALPFSIQSPYLALQFAIAMEGIFPSQG